MIIQVKLDNDAINEALTQYVINRGIDTEGKNINITTIAGRKDKGLSATIEIGGEVEVKTPPKKKRAAKQTKAKVDKIVDAIEEEAETTETVAEENVEAVEEDKLEEEAVEATAEAPLEIDELNETKRLFS